MISDLETLASSINANEFSNDSGLTTIAVTDTTIDATTLASTIDSYDTISAGITDMTLASGATINVDAGEITEMLADESAGRLTIVDQVITVNSATTFCRYSESSRSDNNRSCNSVNSNNRSS